MVVTHSQQPCPVHLSFEVLGPLQITMNGESQPFPRGRTRALLATLLLHPDQLMSPRQLIEAVWGEEAMPAHPLPALATAMTRLRKQLGGISEVAAAAVAGSSTGYTFDTAAAAVDTVLFHDRMRQAVTAASLGQVDEADRHLERALRTWRGPALPEVESDQLHNGEIARLQDEYLLCVERRCVLAFLGGTEVDQIPDLHVQVQRNPGRERMWFYLALALHRAGRSAEALTELQRAFGYLREEFGVDPGADLTHLHLGIVRRDPRLTGDPERIRPWLPGADWLDRGGASYAASSGRPVRG
jgi:DNA-binding SARP family transcriptional activator